MKILTRIALCAVAAFCSSCYTYRIPEAAQQNRNTETKRTAYVVNASLKKELRILSESQLFILVNDSLNADLQIRLYPMKRHLACGQAGVVSMVTLGQLPVTYRDGYSYSFDEIVSGTIVPRTLGFEMSQRVWFWDVFCFNKRFEEKAGKMVLGNYQTLKR